MAINAINGITSSTSTVINGISGVDEVNGLELSGGGGGAIALVAHLEEGLGTNGGTSGGINTTGADLIVAAVPYYSAITGTVASITDSKGNTYTARTDRNTGIYGLRLFDCAAPIVGAGHTFTVAVNDSYSGILVLAFSGTHASPFDQENGASASQPGSLTPSVPDCVVVSAAESSTGAQTTPDGGFTSFGFTPVGGQHVGGGVGYLIQTTAVAANPTWSGTVEVSAIASYKPA